MKLNEEEVVLLINTLQPTVEYYRDVNTKRYEALLALYKRLDQWHETTLQLERE